MFDRLQSWATTILSSGEVAPGDAPAVRDRASCAKWLECVPIADPTSASDAIANLLDELHDSELAGPRYIEILEQLRPTILGLQAQLIEQLAGRGVPLQPRVKESFAAVQRLWGQLARSYVRAFEEHHPNHDPAHLRQLLARALEAMSGLILGHYQARQQLPASTWDYLHSMWRRLERTEQRHGLEISTPNPGDTILSSADTTEPSGADIYVFNVLIHLAEPYRLSPRQLGIVRGWAIRWARKVHIKDVEAHAARLASGAVSPSELAQSLDLLHLETSLLKRIQAIERGVAPEALGLGRDCSADEAAELLPMLHRRWCQPPRAPRPDRAPQPISMVVTAESILTPRSSAGRGQSPSTPWIYGRHSRDVYALAGPSTQDEPDTERDSDRDSDREDWWLMRNDGPEVELRRDCAGARINTGLLVALRRAPGAVRTLGRIDWVVEETTGAVRIGVRLFLGTSVFTQIKRGDDSERAGMTICRGILITSGGGSRLLITAPGKVEQGDTIALPNIVDGAADHRFNVGASLYMTIDFIASEVTPLSS